MTRALIPSYLGVALLLAGCAHPQAAAVAPISYAAEPTLAVAQLLAAAEIAAQGPARDKPALAPTLAALARLGAHPALDSEDPVAAWYALLPSGASQPPVRGRMLGPAYRRGTLDAGGSVTLDQLFDGGRQARVAVATPGAEPVSIAVVDGAGKPVCTNDVLRRGHCNWVPPFSARHQIVIKNSSTIRAAYYLAIY